VASAGPLCKFAPRSRQISTPAPHHSVFTGQMPFLPPNQQRQSTEGQLLGRLRCSIISRYGLSLPTALVSTSVVLVLSGLRLCVVAVLLLVSTYLLTYLLNQDYMEHENRLYTMRQKRITSCCSNGSDGTHRRLLRRSRTVRSIVFSRWRQWTTRSTRTGCTRCGRSE